LIAARAQRGISDSILSNDSDFSGRSSLVEGIFHERSPKATIKQAPFPTSRLRQIAYLSQSLAARKLALDLACPAQKWPMYASFSEDQASRKRWWEKHFPASKKIRV
jgi:hypothetical protein